MTIQLSLTRNSLRLPAFADTFAAISATAKNVSTSLFHNVSTGSMTSGFSDSARTNQLRKQFKKNKFFFIPVAVVVLLLLVGVIYTVRNAAAGRPVVAGASDTRVELKPALATQKVNKDFSFPLKDAAGKEVSKIKFTVENAELRDEIIVKGQRATSVKGRTFLIIPIKITNTFNQPVEINARDYVRLSINNSNEKLAPDIHNDPVEVQAISTKSTRLGFPISDTDKNLILSIGEINGTKENITLTLKK